MLSAPAAGRYHRDMRLLLVSAVLSAVDHGTARIDVDIMMANTGALLRKLSAADGHSEEIAITGTLSHRVLQTASSAAKSHDREDRDRTRQGSHDKGDEFLERASNGLVVDDHDVELRSGVGPDVQRAHECDD